jgi:hypothetical protein
MFDGNWQNKITNDENLGHFKNIDPHGHPTSSEGF